MTESNFGSLESIDYLDLGALKIPLIGQPEIRMNIDQATMQIVGISIVINRSIAEVQVFARAKDEPLWPQVRADLESALTEQAIDFEISVGVFGYEVSAVMPLQDIDGNNVLQSVRFIGIDGERWFLRASISGSAAVSEPDISLMNRILGGVIVDRGSHPMAPGELITCDLPEFGVESDLA